MFFAVFYTGVCVDIGHFFRSAWQYKTSIATVALLKLFPVVMYYFVCFTTLRYRVLMLFLLKNRIEVDDLPY